MTKASTQPALRLNITAKTLKTWQEEKAWHCTDRYFEALHYHLNEVWDADTVTCHFCGWNDWQFTELHHLDGDHNNYAPDNLKPICSLCHRHCHPGWIASSNLGHLTVVTPQDRPSRSLESGGLSTALVNHIQRFFLVSECLPNNANANIDKNREFYKGYRIYCDFVSEAEGSLVGAADIKDGEGKAVSTDKVINTHVHLLDVIEALQQAQEAYEQYKGSGSDLVINPVEAFEAAQIGKDNYLGIIFNANVFKPYHPNCGYTFADRMAFYVEEKLLTPAFIGDAFDNYLKQTGKKGMVDDLEYKLAEYAKAKQAYKEDLLKRTVEQVEQIKKQVAEGREAIPSTEQLQQFFEEQAGVKVELPSSPNFT